jgi:anti-sigma factor RsiW
VRHSRANARLSDFVEGDLEPVEHARVAAHVTGCGECTRDLAELRATVSLLQRLPDPELPPGFTAAVMARVRAGDAEPQGFGHWLRRLAEPAFALPLAAGVAGLGIFLVVRGGLVPGAELRPAAPAGVALALPAERAPSGVASGEQESRIAVRGNRPPLNRALPVPLPGQSIELAHLLRGAGHPHSLAFAGQLSTTAPPIDEREPSNLALVDWSPR